MRRRILIGIIGLFFILSFAKLSLAQDWARSLETTTVETDYQMMLEHRMAQYNHAPSRAVDKIPYQESLRLQINQQIKQMRPSLVVQPSLSVTDPTPVVILKNSGKSATARFVDTTASKHFKK